MSNPTVSSDVQLYFTCDWLLGGVSEVNGTRLLEMVSEVIYFNGAAYKRLVQPFQIRICPDNNNSFEEAEEIDFGTYLEYVYRENDPEDYYKVWLEEGQFCSVQLGHSWFVGWPESDWYLALEAFLYNPGRVLEASLPFQGAGTSPLQRQMNFTAKLTGWWYIRVRYVVGEQIYTLDISTSEVTK